MGRAGGSGELSAKSQEEWISGKNQRLSIAEPREKLEFCAASWVVLNEKGLQAAPWSLVGLGPEDGGNPTAGLTYLLD